MIRLRLPLRETQSCLECWRLARHQHVHHLELLLSSPVAFKNARLLSSTAVAPSGHNRWSKIRHKKGAADSQRGIVFSKITNEIYLALRPPNSLDPETNPRLSAALAKAREAGVPKSNVDTAFHKALNPNEGSSLQSITYEAIGAGGQVALIIECLTDNQNRCVQRVKEQLREHGARMSPVAFQFERKGIIRVTPSTQTTATQDELFEKLFAVVVDAGAEDVRVLAPDDEGGEEAMTVYEIITPPSHLSPISTHLSSSPTYAVRTVELAYMPTNPLDAPEDDEPPSETDGNELISAETAEKVVALLDGLDTVPEVTRVWTNVRGL